jgi:hypothetical protein
MQKSILEYSQPLENKNFFICFDGTWANKNYQSVTRYNLLTATNSTIAQLYEESPLKGDDKLYFPGPGTDETGLGFTNWIAGASGDTGRYSVDENTNRAYDEITKKLELLKEGETLNLQVAGWSRGGVAVDRLLSRLARELLKDLKDKIDIIVCNKIDPVPGGVFDRGNKITQLANLGKSDVFTKKIHSFTYYSDSGALNLTSLLKNNFSALYDPNHQSKKYAFPANHEQIAGIKDENGSSDIVKEHIKATGVFYGIQTYELNKENFQQLDFPENVSQRGFLNPELKGHRFYHRIFGAPNLSESMRDDIKSPQDCVDDISNTMKKHDVHNSFFQEQLFYESCLGHEQSILTIDQKEYPSHNFNDGKPKEKFSIYSKQNSSLSENSNVELEKLKNSVLKNVLAGITAFKTRNKKALDMLDSDQDTYATRAKTKLQDLITAQDAIKKVSTKDALINSLTEYNQVANRNTAKHTGWEKTKTPPLLFANYAAIPETHVCFE